MFPRLQSCHKLGTFRLQTCFFVANTLFLYVFSYFIIKNPLFYRVCLNTYVSNNQFLAE